MNEHFLIFVVKGLKKKFDFQRDVYPPHIKHMKIKIN